MTATIQPLLRELQKRRETTPQPPLPRGAFLTWKQVETLRMRKVPHIDVVLPQDYGKVTTLTAKKLKQTGDGFEIVGSGGDGFYPGGNGLAVVGSGAWEIWVVGPSLIGWLKRATGGRRQAPRPPTSPRRRDRLARPSPSVPAKEFTGVKMRGNDGETWISTKNVNGVWQWRRRHPSSNSCHPRNGPNASTNSPTARG